jgi:hypothetical protein
LGGEKGHHHGGGAEGDCHGSLTAEVLRGVVGRKVL